MGYLQVHAVVIRPSRARMDRNVLYRRGPIPGQRHVFKARTHVRVFLKLF